HPSAMQHSGCHGAARRAALGASEHARRPTAEVQERWSAFAVAGVTSLERNDSPIMTTARTKYAQVSTVFRGRKFAAESWFTSRPKIHSAAERPPPRRRIRRAEFE